MSMEKNIRFELLARLCPNTTGAELRSVCTEAGIYQIMIQGCLQSEQEGKLSVKKIYQILLRRSSKATVSSHLPKNIWFTIDSIFSKFARYSSYK